MTGCGQCGQPPKSVPAHTAHSPDDDGEVGTFSTVKLVLFQLSRFRSNSSSGYFFDCQVGTFSLDKNKLENREYIESLASKLAGMLADMRGREGQ